MGRLTASSTHGADGIPERWVQPIGRKIKVACLNLGELGSFGNQLSPDVDNMTERIARQVMTAGREAASANRRKRLIAGLRPEAPGECPDERRGHSGAALPPGEGEAR